MLTNVYLSGRLGDIVDKNIRYVEVECPLASQSGKRKYDYIPVYSPLGKSACFFKAKNGTFVIIKGRVKMDEKHGLIVHSEIEEIIDFKKEDQE